MLKLCTHNGHSLSPAPAPIEVVVAWQLSRLRVPGAAAAEPAPCAPCRLEQELRLSLQITDPDVSDLLLW